VDSSAWIALFSARDQNHSDADRAFRKALESKKRLFTSNLVLAEIHNLLLYSAGPLAAKAVLDRIESSDRVKIEFANDGHHQAARLWLAKLSDLHISYTDAISFTMMKSANSNEAIGYDRHFSAAGFLLFSRINK
jgi:predicted nucleic acid-binding protein